MTKEENVAPSGDTTKLPDNSIDGLGDESPRIGNGLVASAVGPLTLPRKASE